MPTTQVITESYQLAVSPVKAGYIVMDYFTAQVADVAITYKIILCDRILNMQKG